EFDSAATAAQALIARGAYRVLVTNGAQPAALSSNGDILSERPPEVMVTRVTGAGDTFMASHIAAEFRGESGAKALHAALVAAANYVSGETPL
ncbi:MAG: PfkB family carbohydrate kinase, partial [Halocynthiibacter sp.]